MKRAGLQRRVSGWPVLARLLGCYLRPYTGPVGLVVVLLAVQAGGNLYLPALNASLINDGVLQGDVGEIGRLGGIMLGIVLALGVVSVVTVHRAARVATRAGADLRAALYRRVRQFSAGDMSRFGISSLVTRNVNDVQQVQLFLLTALNTLVTAVIMSIGAVIMAVREGPVLSLLLVVAAPAMALAVGAVVIAMISLFRAIQVKIDRINQLMREQITGARVIRAFLRTRSEQDRFREANGDITAIALRATRILAVIMPLLLGIANLSSVGVLWFGGRLVSESALSVGNLTAFLMYIMQILLALGSAVTVAVLIPRAIASAERIAQVLEHVPAIADPPRPVIRRRVSGAVRFRRVTFGYPGSERPVLRDLSFTLRPGQTSAVVGGTGSGKTTLLNLIPRFLDATSGSVLVHGVDVRKQSAAQLRAAIGLVPQTGFLFAGTVASNLRFGGPGATDEQLWHALEVAQARDFVASLPGQLEARIDQGGTNVSGGQRQRLSIARALVRRPRLYLLDDCFAALDTVTDARLRDALRVEAADAAVLIVAQRASTIMQADQIIVLDAGAIAGIGTHQELLAGCGAYRELVASQLDEAAMA
jgi:ABC-type multidrug transport system fused ATPase/permease subunit